MSATRLRNAWRAWRSVVRAAGVLPAATTVVCLCAASSGAASTIGWGARASLDGGYTDGVFHDETLSSPDHFAALATEIAGRLRPAPGLRLEAVGGVTAERYQTWTAADHETWAGELRARVAGFRLRARGRYAPHLMLYPDVPANAVYRFSDQLGGIEWNSVRGLLAGLELRHEHQVYDLEHLGRTQNRVRWSAFAGWEPRPGRSLAVRFDNEHAVADDPDYTFWDNALTVAGALPLGAFSARVEVAEGIRNYFPNTIFASNWRRHDRIGAYRLLLGHALGPVEVTLRDEYLVRGSSRIDHNYHVNELGLALGWSLGR